MKQPVKLVVFTLDEQRYGLYLSTVERVVRVVEVTSLPSAPEIVMGVINLAGRIIPVVNIRKRFRLPEKDVGLDDHLIIAATPRRIVALLVDSVTTLVEIAADNFVRASSILPQAGYLDGVAKLEDGMILIHDLDSFLSLEEERELDKAILENLAE